MQPEYQSACYFNHVRVTTMVRLVQGHLHPLLEHPRLTYHVVGGEHSSK
jgi:hypothetical protein